MRPGTQEHAYQYLEYNHYQQSHQLENRRKIYRDTTIHEFIVIGIKANR